MSINAHESAPTHHVDDYVREQRKLSLASSTEELASLRLSILLTAKWTTSDRVSPERRGELSAELSNLRSLYQNKIDEIAMTFGVQIAIEVKEEIEQEVFIPDDMNLSMLPVDSEQPNF